MRGFGNIHIFAPSDPMEAEQIIRHALEYVGPVYVRLDSAKFPLLHDESYRFRPGQVDILQRGEEISIFAMGSTVHEAYSAGMILKSEGVNAEVINISSIRPLDRKGIIESVSKTGVAITVEEHSMHGGIGSLVSEIIAEEGIACRVKRLGFAEGKFAVSGPREKMREHIGIDSDSIVNTALTMVRAKA
jgi:transketolase